MPFDDIGILLLDARDHGTKETRFAAALGFGEAFLVARGVLQRHHEDDVVGVLGVAEDAGLAGTAFDVQLHAAQLGELHAPEEADLPIHERLLDALVEDAVGRQGSGGPLSRQGLQGLEGIVVFLPGSEAHSATMDALA